jgi:hypothetical protein
VRRTVRILSTLFLAMSCLAITYRPASSAGFSNSSLSGSYGFQFNKFGTCPNVEVVIGVFNFDGAGNVTGSFTKYDSNKQPKVSTGSASGTYAVNSDGTGHINFASPDSVNFGFVIDASATTAQRLELIVKSLPSTSCAESGYAIQQ